MNCSGICFQYKAIASKDRFRYLNGQKRCRECEVFLECNQNVCPCCGGRLRIKPRNMKARMRQKWLDSKIFY
jgi:rRNA maturation endonuclease Nob1